MKPQTAAAAWLPEINSLMCDAHVNCIAVEDIGDGSGSIAAAELDGSSSFCVVPNSLAFQRSMTAAEALPLHSSLKIHILLWCKAVVVLQ